MVGDNVGEDVGDNAVVGEKYVRPRLSVEELWTLYRLVDDRYWYLRKQPPRFRSLVKISRLRLKLLRNLNKTRESERQLSARRRVY